MIRFYLGLFFVFLNTCVAVEYVTSNLVGQLGNQMFQIAAAVGYALDHDCIATFPNLKDTLGASINCRYVLHRVNTDPIPEGVQIHLYHDAIYPNVYSPIPYEEGKSLCIIGHFECPAYFSRHEKAIRELFAPTQEILDEIDQKYGEILKKQTVAVHFRTYIPDSLPLFINSDWEYFTTAIQHFPEDYEFLIFSDAIAWVKTHFPFHALPNRKFTFIEGNPHHIDFYLMSLCQNQIVSPESTFSWWAAWLNENPHKEVIACNSWNGWTEIDTLPVGWWKLPKRAPHILQRQE